MKKAIIHMHAWKEKFYLFEDVPAEVCTQCGETYFSPEVLDAIDRMVESGLAPKTTVSIPVFSLSSVVGT